MSNQLILHKGLIKNHLKSRELGIRVPVPRPQDYVSKIASALKAPKWLEGRAVEILDGATEAGLTGGKDPSGLAAAALYIAGVSEGWRMTQRKISKAAGVTEVTVRNRYLEIARELDMEFSE